MLRPDEVTALAHDEGLGALADELVGWVRAGWRMVPSGEPAETATSRIGGSPDLAPDETWPLGIHGNPLAFAAQIDCRSLPEIDEPWRDRLRPWAHGDQLLRLFTDVLYADVVGPARASLCDPEARLRRVAAPAVPDPWTFGGETAHLDVEDRAQLYVLDETPVRFEPFLTAPEWHPVARPITSGKVAPIGWAYDQWRYRLQADGARHNEVPTDQYLWVQHVLGEATSIQEDARGFGTMVHARDPGWRYERGGRDADSELADEEAWQILLGLHASDALGLSIHDGGALHILAPVTDLAAGRLDRLVYGVESS